MTEPVGGITSANGSVKGLYEGLTLSDASKDNELNNIFAFADMDGDGVISSEEVQRCSNPILVKDNAGNTRIVNVGDENNLFSYEQEKIQKFEMQYYSGLKKEDVSTEYLKDFNAIYLDGDGILSDEEVSKIASYKNEIDEAKDELENLRDYKIQQNNLSSGAKAGLGLFSVAGLGICSTLGGLIFMVEGGTEGLIVLGALSGFGLAAGLAVAGISFLAMKIQSNHHSQVKKEPERVETEVLTELEQKIDNNKFYQEEVKNLYAIK